MAGRACPSRRRRRSHGRRRRRPPPPSPLPSAEAEVAIEWTRVLGILAVGATLAIGHLLERNHIHILPEAAVGVLIGALSAAATTYLHDDAMLDGERFNFYVFTDYLLPPIIFEAGYNMEVRRSSTTWAPRASSPLSAPSPGRRSAHRYYEASSPARWD